MRRIEEPKLLQGSMGILQERHSAHRVGPDHQTVSKIDVALALFAFEEKVGNRISMFAETSTYHWDCGARSMCNLNQEMRPETVSSPGRARTERAGR